ncbi:Signal transduction histidine kinase [Nannocystis exedens]|uniref:histidine kinase n=1 Tax=Nannocystis exedens TaxID=54 RepID=A0A1I1ZRV5_9BACT|nr:ATP-binding protein [Nannocystis exedens]PCC75404.1 Autoinducer 2 sensor kinase/phosphatase LuxQ [Nannocystis exedens]SFE33180.1 Signal transduction histidine kinase [Nannocystis exedens]
MREAASSDRVSALPAPAGTERASPRRGIGPLLVLVLGVAGLGLAVALFVGGQPILYAASAFAAGALLLWCVHAIRVRDSLIHDLTAERAVLHASRQQIDAVSRAKSDFIANISHEIRTPLSGVLGTTALLADTPLNDEQRAYLAAIRGAAEGLMALLGDILDMSKIEAGHLTFERSPFDLRKLAEEVIAMFGYVSRDKGLGLRLNYPEGAPRVFFGDPLRIRQVLTNLVSNAVKFTVAGEVRTEIRVGPLLHDEATVELRVQDTGIGITAEQLPRIFDSFVQADASTTRRFGGTGLGLAICRALVRGMGGSLDVESEPGSGSTFTASIPLTVASEHDLSQGTGTSPTSERRLKIVLADDNRINRTVVLALLERAGHTVFPVENGLAAVAAVEANSPDIVFMDCQMPIMDGYEATARLREAGCTAPIIALTANARADDRERCLAAGMTDYLTKPIRPEDLHLALHRHVLAPDPPASEAAAPAAQ